MFFWNSLAFSMIQCMLAIWSLVPLPFLTPAWTSGSSWFTYCWSLAWRILSITLLGQVLWVYNFNSEWSPFLITYLTLPQTSFSESVPLSAKWAQRIKMRSWVTCKCIQMWAAIVITLRLVQRLLWSSICKGERVVWAKEMWHHPLQSHRKEGTVCGTKRPCTGGAHGV